MTRQALKTPRAAAVAGIIFAVLFTVSLVLIRIALPEEVEAVDASDSDAWVKNYSAMISVALTLMPFAGIAFLWFIGVVRDRLGELEDQLFSTVFFGSGLLFLAMMFTSAAVAGGILSSYASVGNRLIASGVLAFGRAVMYTITNVYAIRMAGVFMIALGTIWILTRAMPRLFVFLSYGLALVMLVSINLTPLLILAFPAWVFIISVYILIESLRGENLKAQEIIGLPDEKPTTPESRSEA